jgi:hypothetical protein
MDERLDQRKGKGKSHFSLHEKIKRKRRWAVIPLRAWTLELKLSSFPFPSEACYFSLLRFSHL